MFIRDYYSFGQLQLINEAKSKADGKMRLRGLFSEAEVINKNKRIYNKAILENEIKRLQPVISERKFVGELDHPQSTTVSYSNAAHLVTNLYMEGNKVIGEIEILNTPAGKTVQALIKDGVSIGVSSRATGSLIPVEEGNHQVGDDLKFICWDIVADPSCMGAHPALYESTDYEVDHKKQTNAFRNERIYLNLLKNSLRKR